MRRIIVTAAGILFILLLVFSMFQLVRGCGQIGTIIGQKGLRSIVEEIWEGKQNGR